MSKAAGEFSALLLFLTAQLHGTLSRWRDVTPPDFVIAVKASRFITHIRRLEEPAETVKPYLDLIGSPGSKPGPVLFQLPSRFPFNGDKLNAFCKVLSDDLRYVFEFRDHDWYRQETCDILRNHNIAFRMYNFYGTQSPETVTADFNYIRFHGPLKTPHRGA
ncbi:MAG: DUF72 domain-containing protein [Deltaproteobacteria bacterium]|nr:DUF72 domain-containing protein [Deltaproteobacteria bacterium]